MGKERIDISYSEKNSAWSFEIKDLSFVFVEDELCMPIERVKKRFLKEMELIFDRNARAAFNVDKPEPDDPYNLRCRMEDTEDSEGNVC